MPVVTITPREHKIIKGVLRTAQVMLASDDPMTQVCYDLALQQLEEISEKDSVEIEGNEEVISLEPTIQSTSQPITRPNAPDEDFIDHESTDEEDDDPPIVRSHSNTLSQPIPVRTPNNPVSAHVRPIITPNVQPTTSQTPPRLTNTQQSTPQRSIEQESRPEPTLPIRTSPLIVVNPIQNGRDKSTKMIPTIPHNCRNCGHLVKGNHTTKVICLRTPIDGIKKTKKRKSRRIDSDGEVEEDEDEED